MLLIVGTVCIAFTVYIVYTGDMTDSATGPVTDTPAKGDEDRRSLVDQYRPHTFDEMFGQESAVDCLSGLIARGQIGRNILLHGAVGSGKTTLAKIYARALNSEAPDPAMSPCNDSDCSKRSGEDPIENFEEYNVSRFGGGREAVRNFVNIYNYPVHGTRYRILFFDEAHALEREACDFLLNLIEFPEHPVLFFFATTEVEKIGEALRSRLFDLLIRPLPVDRAIEFLHGAAKKAGIQHEPGALSLLAGLRKGYPRDLLLGLERVWDRKSSLTVEQVRAAFDVDQTEVLVDYFSALAVGDRDRAAMVVSGWRERETDKIRWIQAFLLHVYHNDILARRLIVDGVIEAIPTDRRAGIIQAFCRRLCLPNPIDLAQLWRRWINFWPVPETVADETALGLRILLFNELVTESEGGETNGLRVEPSRLYQAADETAPTVAVVASRGFGPPPMPRPGAPVFMEEAGFLTAADVRRIVNCASFLMQEHGLLFNAAFVIRPKLLGLSGLEAAVAITAFHQDLALMARAWTDRLFASIAVLQRDHSGVIGRVVAHLPGKDVEGRERIAAWARAWRNGSGRPGGDVVEFSSAPTGDQAALGFHWRKTIDLCTGLNPSVEAWDPTVGHYRPLIKLLGVTEGERTFVTKHPLVAVSASLSEEAVAGASSERLEPLSAYDDEAWDELRRGWELQEFDERCRTRAERARRLGEIRQKHGWDTPEGRTEVERIVSTWPDDPRRRRRRWRGWRAEQPWPAP